MAQQLKRPNNSKTQVMDDGDLFDLIADVVPQSNQWLDAPNAEFGGRTPRDVIGQSKKGETLVREMVLGYKYGVFS